MKVERLDHLVLTVRDVSATCVFYAKVLGMTETIFGEGRKALAFGSQKINLHLYRHEFEPKAASPVPGSADLCFMTATPLTQVIEHLQACDVAILEGPVPGPVRLGLLCRCTSRSGRQSDRSCKLCGPGSRSTLTGPHTHSQAMSRPFLLILFLLLTPLSLLAGVAFAASTCPWAR